MTMGQEIWFEGNVLINTEAECTSLGVDKHTSFDELKESGASVAPTSEVRALFVLLLLIERN
jgi:hypothetical protein